MINSVVLVGRLTAEPELRKTPNGVSSLQGTLAVNRNFKNHNGEREADFINFQSWRGVADVIAQYCSKGSLIGITGRIQTRNYENQQGQRVYVTEVVADNFQLLESQKERGNNQPQANSQPDFGRQADPFVIDDDSLPF